MYAIVETGSKQYKVEKGDVIDVENIDAKPGDTVHLDVVMLADGGSVAADKAKLAVKKVDARVLEHHKDKKITMFKFHKRKRYARTKGHRQLMTKLEITALPAL